MSKALCMIIKERNALLKSMPLSFYAFGITLTWLSLHVVVYRSMAEALHLGNYC